MAAMVGRRVEITDLLWRFDDDGVRSDVSKAEALDRLRSGGQQGAARILDRMPSTGGVLDPDYVDRLGLRVHCELQRLGEELQFGRRVAATLAPIVQRLAADGPVRVIDVGCGLGYVVRWLAASRALAGEIDLLGVDFNAVVIAAASRLADREGLACRFIQGDALDPALARIAGGQTVVISSGLLHHLEPDRLADFFTGQERLGVSAFAHWDIAPCAWSTVGAWVFHRARMREAVSRHDGLLSARRSYPASMLLEAARQGAPGYLVEVQEGGRWHPRAIDVLRPIVGLRA